VEQHNSDLHDRWDPAAGRFLSDMQALRAQAGLDQGELAARAHYPRDMIAAAESVLPELPVLAAYVRGCGGTGDDMVEWEDRWRSVTGAAASPVLSARVAGLSGLSGAAAAGARLSEESSMASPEEQDPTVVLSALHRFADRMAQPTSSGPGSRSPDGAGTATEEAGTVQASGASEASGVSEASGESEASGASATGVDGVPEVAARDEAGTGAAQNGAGTGAIISGNGDSAGRERPTPLQHVPREESGDPDGQRGLSERRDPDGQRGPGGQRSGTSGRTLAVVVVAAALLCLLIILLAF
jgi:hypothetical protein